MTQKERLDSKRIGQTIDGLRKKKGWTLEKFADEAYVDIRTIQRWVKNGVTSLKILAEIADLFNVTLEDIIFERG